MNTVTAIAGAILLIAAGLTMYRFLAGPSTLDRIVATDTLVSVAMSGLAVWAIFSGDTTVVPAIVALSLVGFLGSATAARFRVRDKPVRADESARGDGDHR